MAQKWSSGADNVYINYNLSSESESHLHNISSNTSTPAINTQISGSSEILLPAHNSYMESDVKETCARNSKCSISQNNYISHQENMETDKVDPAYKSLKFSRSELSSFIGSPYKSTTSSTQHGGMYDSKCGNHQEEASLQNLSSCFVCCFSPLVEKSFVSIKESTNYSHAPLLVLLMDVLGYKLDSSSLHTQVVCKSCYQLLDTIDELQQTLTESKTDLRTKFLETIQKLKLKYPRTDKMLKPRCLRCVQMGQITSRKKQKGGAGRLPKRKGAEETSIRENKNISEICSEEEISIQEEESGSEFNTNIESYGNEKAPASDDDSKIIYDTDPVFFSPDEKLKAGHLEKEGIQMFVCAYCSAKYDSTLSLKMHVRVYHMPSIVYDSGQGTAEARYRMGMKLQNVVPNEFKSIEKPYSCLLCASVFKLQSSLQFHFRENHSPHKPFQCPECKECFRQTVELSRHRISRCSVR